VRRDSRQRGLPTIASAVSLLLKLLAGIWGMNFRDRPVLSDPVGFPIALAMMAITGVGIGLDRQPGNN
jgi:Mg2+ and Co2+ transporter CorA